MPTVPQDRLGRIEFYEAHLLPWTNSAALIGVTPAAVTALSALTVSARKAYNDHVAAQMAAKAATQKFYDAVRSMHSGPGAGSDMIAQIKNYAATTNNPNVYVLANIPPPSAGGTVPPPGTPFDFGVQLLQDGSVKLSWKCSNPSGTGGTIYEVKRKLGPAMGGAFAFVGASGIKSFTDDSIPVGSSPVTYQITATRSTTRGNPAQFAAQFGVGGGGGVTVQSVTAETPATTTEAGNGGHATEAA